MSATKENTSDNASATVRSRGVRNSRKCSICFAREYRGNKMTFFSFPTDEVLCREWLRLTGIEDLVFIPVEKLRKRRYLCESHFELKAFNKKKTRLRRWSVPTLNLKNPPLTDEQLEEYPQHMWNYKPPEPVPNDNSGQPSEVMLVMDCQENESALQNSTPKDIQETIRLLRKPYETYEMIKKKKELTKQLKLTLNSMKRSVNAMEIFLKELSTS